jgi:hypothetical protein
MFPKPSEILRKCSSSYVRTEGKLLDARPMSGEPLPFLSTSQSTSWFFWLPFWLVCEVKISNMGPTTIPIHQTTTSSSPGHHRSVSTAAHTHTLDLHSLSLSRYGQEGAQGSAREGSRASVARRRSGELGEIEVRRGSAGQWCFCELGSSARSATSPSGASSSWGRPRRSMRVSHQPGARDTGPLAIAPWWP